MSKDIQVTCIKRGTGTKPHEHIKYIGGVNPNGSRWSLSQADAIKNIENGTYQFYVYDVAKNKKAWVKVAQRDGYKYLTTEADGVVGNNLLSLSECP